MLSTTRVSLAGLAVLFGGCASLSGGEERYLVCPYETVWQTALETVDDRPVTIRNRATGVIETGWIEVSAPGRTFGALRREIAGSKDRSRLTLTVKKLNDVTAVQVVETRQRWAFRGGSRMFGWTPAEPSEETMTEVLSRLNDKLKERGCHAA